MFIGGVMISDKDIETLEKVAWATDGVAWMLKNKTRERHAEAFQDLTVAINLLEMLISKLNGVRSKLEQKLNSE